MKTRKLLWLFATIGTLAAGCKKSNETPTPAPEPDPEPVQPTAAFSFNFKDVTSEGATIEVTPADNSEYYTWDVMTSEDYKQHYTSTDELITEHVSYIQSQLEKYQSEVDPNGTLLDLLNIGFDSQRLTSLTPETEYTVFAFGMNEDGTPVKNAAVSTFTTPKFELADKCTFTIKAGTMSQLHFSFTVTPTDNNTRYYVGLADIEDLKQYSPEDIASGMISQANVAEVDWANTDLLISGEHTLDTFDDLGISDLEADTEYSIIVFGVSTLGERTTAVAHAEFRTAKVPTSSMTFDINVVETYADGALIRIIPSVKDEDYMAGCVQRTEYDKFKKEDGTYDDGAFMEYLIENGNLTLYSGDTELNKKGNLLTEKKYICFAFGYLGGATTGLFIKDFETGKHEASGEAAVEITKLTVKTPSSNPAADGDLYAYLKPNEKAEHWYSAFFRAKDGVAIDYYDDPMTDSEIISALAGGAGNTDKESISRAVKFGNEYIIYAFAKDAAGNIGKLTKQVVIPTESMVEK